MSPLRDLLIAPSAEADAAPPTTEPPATGVHGHSLGVLASARDLPAVAIAAGLALARRRSAVLVSLYAPHGAITMAPVRMPARVAAARLAASLAARGLDAEARGRVALARLPDDPAELEGAAARAVAAAGALPTVLAVARRAEGIDLLLAAQDAILVALGPEADPALAGLALAGAMKLTASAAAVTLTLDPAQRTLALAGCRPPRTIRHVVEGLLA